MVYTSNGDRTRCYFDQDQDEELCGYRVDLGTSPSFLDHGTSGGLVIWGFLRCIDFALGFDMDSTEILCGLRYEGVKCGSVMSSS